MMYETIKMYFESDYLATLTSEQKVIYRLLQSSRMPEGSRVPGIIPEKGSEAHFLESVGLEFYKIFLTDDTFYAKTREAIKSDGNKSAKNVIVILSSAVALKFHFVASSCSSFVVYLIITILRAGFAATLEGFNNEEQTVDG